MPTVVASEDQMIDSERIATALPDADVRTARTETEADLIDALDGAAAFVANVSAPVTRSVLDACPDLRIVARAGVGIDNVDIRAAADSGVVVTNTPDYCTDEVATHTVSLLLACVRNLRGYDRGVRAGGWGWHPDGPIHRLTGATLGLVSFGPIARGVVERLSGFDLDAVAYDPYVDADEMAAHGVEKVDFETLLDRSRLVSVNAPLTEATRNLIDADALDRLPDDAVLVNTGRGGVVDEEALAAALDDGIVAGAGLDVFASEPPTDSPLLDCERALLSPHAAWYSEEARTELHETVAANVRAALADETPPDRIDPDADWV
jgi:D-3-phosphoglycerate dehydrogenase